MEEKPKWKAAFEISKLSLEHPDSCRFVQSPWRLESESRVSLLYLLYRWLVTALFLAVVGWSWYVFWDGGKWFIFLTNWGFLICALQALLGALLVSVAYWRQQTTNIIDSIFNVLDEDNRLPFLYKIYWVMYNIAVTVAIFITILYWSILYKPTDEEAIGSEGPFLLNLATHAGNSVLCIVELIACGIPSRFLHSLQPVLFALVYIIFNLIYWATGGLGPYDLPYIYPVLDWDGNPGLAVGIIFGGCVLLLVIHALVCSVAELRNTLTCKIRRRSENNIIISTVPPRNGGTANKAFVI